MNYIIYDLEATCWEGEPNGRIQETIEIGAVKVSEYGEVLSSYGRFIRPVIHPFLSPFCQQLTTISQVDINQARYFPDVIAEFKYWVGIPDEDYLLCSWGKFDKKLLRMDCEQHDLEYDWLDPHINLKQQYREIKKLPKACGLRSAVRREGFEFTGIHHRGIDDADNLAKIFLKYIDVWQV